MGFFHSRKAKYNGDLTLVEDGIQKPTMVPTALRSPVPPLSPPRFNPPVVGCPPLALLALVQFSPPPAPRQPRSPRLPRETVPAPPQKSRLSSRTDSGQFERQRIRFLEEQVKGLENMLEELHTRIRRLERYTQDLRNTNRELEVQARRALLAVLLLASAHSTLPKREGSTHTHGSALRDACSCEMLQVRAQNQRLHNSIAHLEKEMEIQRDEALADLKLLKRQLALLRQNEAVLKTLLQAFQRDLVASVGQISRRALVAAARKHSIASPSGLSTRLDRRRLGSARASTESDNDSNDDLIGSTGSSSSTTSQGSGKNKKSSRAVSLSKPLPQIKPQVLTVNLPPTREPVTPFNQIPQAFFSPTTDKTFSDVITLPEPSVYSPVGVACIEEELSDDEELTPPLLVDPSPEIPQAGLLKRRGSAAVDGDKRRGMVMDAEKVELKLEEEVSHEGDTMVDSVKVDSDEEMEEAGEMEDADDIQTITGVPTLVSPEPLSELLLDEPEPMVLATPIHMSFEPSEAPTPVVPLQAPAPTPALHSPVVAQGLSSPETDLLRSAVETGSEAGERDETEGRGEAEERSEAGQNPVRAPLGTAPTGTIICQEICMPSKGHSDILMLTPVNPTVASPSPESSTHVSPAWDFTQEPTFLPLRNLVMFGIEEAAIETATVATRPGSPNSTPVVDQHAELPSMALPEVAVQPYSRVVKEPSAPPATPDVECSAESAARPVPRKVLAMIQAFESKV